jgi:hypothetical protein
MYRRVLLVLLSRFAVARYQHRVPPILGALVVARQEFLAYFQRVAFVRQFTVRLQVRDNSSRLPP